MVKILYYIKIKNTSTAGLPLSRNLTRSESLSVKFFNRCIMQENFHKLQDHFTRSMQLRARFWLTATRLLSRLQSNIGWGWLKKIEGPPCSRKTDSSQFFCSTLDSLNFQLMAIWLEQRNWIKACAWKTSIGVWRESWSDRIFEIAINVVIELNPL